MKDAIYAGTFDPITLGHLDVVERAARTFETLTVAVALDCGKSPMFTLKERVEIVKEACAPFENVTVEPFSGLLVDFARSKSAEVIVRGLRTVSDFEYEMQMALTNRQLAADIETIFLMPKQDFSYVSSTNVRQIALLGGCVKNFVPPCVVARVDRKLKGGS
ncbi:pantetheine-phosphate adenylyltransferase [Verrucomicrobiota bacterium]